jgi:hypothetical protein
MREHGAARAPRQSAKSPTESSLLTPQKAPLLQAKRRSRALMRSA